MAGPVRPVPARLVLRRSARRGCPARRARRASGDLCSGAHGDGRGRPAARLAPLGGLRRHRHPLLPVRAWRERPDQRAGTDGLRRGAGDARGRRRPRGRGNPGRGDRRAPGEFRGIGAWDHPGSRGHRSLHLVRLDSGYRLVFYENRELSVGISRSKGRVRGCGHGRRGRSVAAHSTDLRTRDGNNGRHLAGAFFLLPGGCSSQWRGSRGGSGPRYRRWIRTNEHRYA